MNATNGPRTAAAFQHKALLYAGEEGLVAETVPLIRSAAGAREPMLVAVGARKIERLRRALGDLSGPVQWTDMAGIGANPARIIPIWREFVAKHAGGRRIWGIGEPIWAGRTPAELVEAQCHEVLLNVAFADVDGFTLLCPYDVEALPQPVVEEACRSHPLVRRADGEQASATYRRPEAGAAPLEAPLPEPPGQPSEISLAGASPVALRTFVSRHAAGAGLDAARSDDLALGAVAVAAGLGGDRGAARVWQEADAVTAEVTAGARVGDPLAGREWPPPAEGAGRGLWLANQLCDLVQLRRHPTGTVVRLRMTR